MVETESGFWRKCSICKSPIGYGANYFVCNVSTCNRKRSGMVFCRLSCWESHVPVMNHREAWAEERKAPKVPQETGEFAAAATKEPAAAGETQPRAAVGPPPEGDEILIVASKLKDYIRRQSGMNTSASVLEVLSKWVRLTADRAIENARNDHRQSVLERDIAAVWNRRRSQTAVQAGQSHGFIRRRRSD